MNADRVRELLLLPVSLLILIGWCAALADAMLANQFTPLTVVTPVMLVFAGFMFGSSIVKRAMKGDEG